MTTKDNLIAECETDLSRTSVDGDIGSEVDKSIRFYQSVPFWFSEARSTTFDTVADQTTYDEATTTALAGVVDIEMLTLEEGGQTYTLTPISIENWQQLQGASSTGRPYWYVRYGQAVHLYPTPGAVYTIRVTGNIVRAGPATDNETGNVWMNEGFELIRARTVRNIAAKKEQDFELASVWQLAEQEELERLRRESSKRMGTGMLRPTAF